VIYITQLPSWLVEIIVSTGGRWRADHSLGTPRSALSLTAARGLCWRKGGSSLKRPAGRLSRGGR